MQATKNIGFIKSRRHYERLKFPTEYKLPFNAKHHLSINQISVYVPYNYINFIIIHY